MACEICGSSNHPASNHGEFAKSYKQGASKPGHSVGAQKKDTTSGEHTGPGQPAQPMPAFGMKQSPKLRRPNPKVGPFGD